MTMNESPREMVYREALERIAARGEHPTVNAVHARVIARNALDEAASAAFTVFSSPVVSEHAAEATRVPDHGTRHQALWGNPVVFVDQGRPGGDMTAEVTAAVEPDGAIRILDVKCHELK